MAGTSLAAAAAAGVAAAAAAPSAPPSGPASVPAVELLGRLPLVAERRSGYDRRRFRHWIDADRDGCTTREEVLLAEALEPPQKGPGCTLAGGRWLSRYDGRRVLAAGGLDVDHAVPLAEAWDSGAWAWDEPTRRSYANDLGAADSLLAVTAASNRAKGDQDPAEWLPRRADRCRYAAAWVATKTRWSLAVDAPEREAIAGVLAGCGPRRLRVAAAEVALAAGGGSQARQPQQVPGLAGAVRGNLPAWRSGGEPGSIRARCRTCAAAAPEGSQQAVAASGSSA